MLRALFLVLPLPALADASISCLILPGEVVELASPVEGIVAEVLAERGAMVATGEVVARLESVLERVAVDAARARAENVASLAAAEARAAFLEAEAERSERLARRGAGSDTAAEKARMEAEAARQSVAEARVERDLARYELDAAEARLERRALRSPIDGLVVGRDVSPGEFRDGRTPLMTIAAIDPLRVEAFVPIDRFYQIAPGDRVEVVPEAPVAGAHSATVTVVDRVFDAASGTFGLVAEMPNPGGALPAGLRCELTFPEG